MRNKLFLTLIFVTILQNLHGAHYNAQRKAVFDHCVHNLRAELDNEQLTIQSLYAYIDELICGDDRIMDENKQQIKILNDQLNGLIFAYEKLVEMYRTDIKSSSNRIQELSDIVRKQRGTIALLKKEQAVSALELEHEKTKNELLGNTNTVLKEKITILEEMVKIFKNPKNQIPIILTAFEKSQKEGTLSTLCNTIYRALRKNLDIY